MAVTVTEPSLPGIPLIQMADILADTLKKLTPGGD